MAGFATPVTVAVMVWPPEVPLAVIAGDVATPDPSVVTTAVVPPPAKLALAPLREAVKVTETPLARFPSASLTVAVNGEPKAEFIFALWPPPLVAVIDAGAPALLVIENAAAVAIPTTVALTGYGPPAVALALKTGDVATPAPSVIAVAVVPPPAKVPLAPLPGAVNVTLTPLMGFPTASFTVAASGKAKVVLTGAFCPPPLVAVTEAGAPAVFVKEKLAGFKTPLTLPLTVYGPPTIPLAVKTGDVATPDALVTAVAIELPPAKVPLVPKVGAEKVTTTPLSKLPPASLTVTANGEANGVFTAVL